MNFLERITEFFTGNKTTERKNPRWWYLPDFDIIDDDPVDNDGHSYHSPAELANLLGQFGFHGSVEGISHGPTVTLYKVKPFGNQSMKPLERFLPDIALRLGAESARFLGQIPGEKHIGLEITNTKRSFVNISQFSSQLRNARHHCDIPIPLGVNSKGACDIIDLAECPHLLIAGQTGSGKSEFLHSIMASILMNNWPSDVKLCLIDPKQVELARYKNLPHNLLDRMPLAVSPYHAGLVLQTMLYEMEQRYSDMAGYGVSNFKELRSRMECIYEPPGLFRIIVVIDEFADLIMMNPHLEGPIIRLAQKARAAGIHLILSTQRPVVKVVTGLIKANIPARVAFRTTSAIDSRVILDEKGAEKLLGAGDLLFRDSSHPIPIRAQAPLTLPWQSRKLIKYWESEECRDDSPTPRETPYYETTDRM